VEHLYIFMAKENFEKDLAEAEKIIKEQQELIEKLRAEILLMDKGKKQIETFTVGETMYRFTVPTPKFPVLLPFQGKIIAPILPDYVDFEGQELTAEIVQNNPKILEAFTAVGFEILAKV